MSPGHNCLLRLVVHAHRRRPRTCIALGSSSLVLSHRCSFGVYTLLNDTVHDKYVSALSLCLCKDEWEIHVYSRREVGCCVWYGPLELEERGLVQ